MFKIIHILAKNVYFDNIHISQTLFKPVLDIIVEKNTFIDKEVKQVFIKVLKENYIFLLKKGLDLDKSDLTKKCLEYYKIV